MEEDSSKADYHNHALQEEEIHPTATGTYPNTLPQTQTLTPTQLQTPAGCGVNRKKIGLRSLTKKHLGLWGFREVGLSALRTEATDRAT